MNRSLEERITCLPGIGEKRAQLFERLGIFTVRDLLSHFPRSYEDRRKATPIAECPQGAPCGILGRVMGAVRESRPKPNFHMMKCKLYDGTGFCTVTFFNSPYLHGKIKEGDLLYCYGKAEGLGASRSMNNPKFQQVQGDYRGRLEPIYPMSQGLSRYYLVAAVEGALALIGGMEETLPAALLERFSLCGICEAYEAIHFPRDPEALAAARRRLVFEEFLTLQLGLFRLKSRRRESNRAKIGAAAPMRAYCAALPFELTKAQKAALNDIAGDLQGEFPMNRLIQGDVGSGKTAVAAAALCAAVQCGYQAALMAPTELLARQHAASLRAQFEKLGIVSALLTGSTPKKEAQAILEQLKSGEIQLLIGTHALLEDRVEFQNLGMVITDEQHRFGVAQRARLSAKGECPHLLVMSATPIPRTLALMLYGDLDISVIDELPPGRKPVLTYGIGQRKRQSAYGFIDRQLEAGRQAYFVCPLVEEGESDLTAATDYTSYLQTEIFPKRRIACLHGRMKPKEKAAVMEAFASHALDILVSTTVIEVGVDVANATVMVIENAERFGLSQLHQLRGRVGRGKEQSYCILFSDLDGEAARKRLEIMCKTNDGFQIAQFDLEQRGPGDFFGQRQHGLPEFHIANLMEDMTVLRLAQDAAKELLEEDHDLSMPEHRGLAAGVNGLFGRETNLFH